MQQGLDDDAEDKYGYLELLQNKVQIVVEEDFLWFSVKRCNCSGEVEGSVVWLSRIDAWLGTVVRCLTERVTKISQQQKFCMLIRREKCWNY